MRKLSSVFLRLPSSSVVIASQLTQSGSSFLLTLVFSKTLNPADFGLLSGLWLVLTLVMSMNRSLFGEQAIANRLKNFDQDGLDDFVTLNVISGALVPPLALFLLFPSNLTSNLIFASICVSVFTSSDLARYLFLAELSAEKIGRQEPKRLITLTETARFLGTALAFVFVLYGHFGVATFCALGASLGWIFIFLAYRGGFSVKKTFQYLSHLGGYEAYMALQFAMLTSVSQLLPLLAGFKFGLVALGNLRLAQSLLAPGVVLASAVQPQLIRHFLSTQGHQSPKLSLRFSAAFAFFGALATATIVFVVYQLVPGLYSASMSVPIRALLLPVALGLAASFAGQPGGAFIRAYRLGKVSLLGQFLGLSVTVILALATLQSSVYTFALALSAGSLSTVVFTYSLLLSSRHRVVALERQRESRE